MSQRNLDGIQTFEQRYVTRKTRDHKLASLTFCVHSDSRPTVSCEWGTMLSYRNATVFIDTAIRGALYRSLRLTTEEGCVDNLEQDQAGC